MEDLNIESWSRPHKRRKGSKEQLGEKKQDLEDMFTSVTFVDQNKLFNRLPVFVAGDPDRLPSIKLPEGDLQCVLTKLATIFDQLHHVMKIIHGSTQLTCSDVTDSMELVLEKRNFDCIVDTFHNKFNSIDNKIDAIALMHAPHGTGACEQETNALSVQIYHGCAGTESEHPRSVSNLLRHNASTSAILGSHGKDNPCDVFTVVNHSRNILQKKNNTSYWAAVAKLPETSQRGDRPPAPTRWVNRPLVYSRLPRILKLKKPFIKLATLTLISRLVMFRIMYSL